MCVLLIFYRALNLRLRLVRVYAWVRLDVFDVVNVGMAMIKVVVCVAGAVRTLVVGVLNRLLLRCVRIV